MFPRKKNELFIFRIASAVVSFVIIANTAVARTPLLFDEFGHLSCADELARLDNYGDKLRTVPGALAVIVVYGGRSGTRRGEVVARLFGIRDHLVRRHSIDSKRIVILDGGYRDNFLIDLWIIPSEGRDSVKNLITPQIPPIPPSSVHLKEPAMTQWQYKCDLKPG